QRRATAMTASTGEGRLFEVDMRLRPSGEDGPIAAHIDSLRQYLEGPAWTWELMALSRARFAIGDAALGARIEALRDEVLARAPTRPDLMADVTAMRARIAQAKPAGGAWDSKLRKGGMLDVEFIAQGLALAHADRAEVRAAHRPVTQLRALAAAGALRPEVADTLYDAARFWLEAQWVCRLVGHDEAAGEVEHRDLQATFAGALGAKDYPALVERREAIARAVAAAYRDVFGMESPAGGD
ncbi:MAG: glutamine-synthetase adenylyltransferase, partial [Alphaproteobacteria bacterium]